MSDLAPIVLLAYNRPWHTEQVLRALKKNILADQSVLYIYIDGVKENASAEEKKKHEEVITIAYKEQWCAEVTVFVSEFNRGCRFGPIFGITEVLKRNNAVIILEDDIVTSKYFLKYMNLALKFYNNYPSVFSISAFNLSEKSIPIPKDYAYDVYVSLRQLNWGWGTWANRWQLVNWDKSQIPNFMLSTKQVEAFNRGGDDLSRMLLEEFEEQSQAWDIQFSFAQFCNHAVSIVPCFSYTQNIGLDNSGTHTLDKTGGLFETDLSKSAPEPKFLPIIYEDKRFINAFYNAFCSSKRPLWKKAINKISRCLLGYNIFVIKKKIFN